MNANVWYPHMLHVHVLAYCSAAPRHADAPAWTVPSRCSLPKSFARFIMMLHFVLLAGYVGPEDMLLECVLSICYRPATTGISPRATARHDGYVNGRLCSFLSACLLVCVVVMC